MEEFHEGSDVPKTPSEESDEEISPEVISAIRGAPLADTAPQLDVKEGIIIGDPIRDTQFYREQERGQNTCALVAQEGVIAKHTGHDPGEIALKQEANRNGWYTEQGTEWPHVGKLLETHGIPVNRWEHADFNILQNELSKGNDVIVGVDTGKYRLDDRYKKKGHALWVTGIKVDAEGNTQGVFLNDSGFKDIDGGGFVPIEVFKNAWDGFGNQMIATEEPANVVSEGA